MEMNITSVADALQNGARLSDEALYLGLGECTLRLRSNSAELIAKLRDYFGHVAVSATQADLEVVAIEREATDLGLEFIDYDLPDGSTDTSLLFRVSGLVEFTGGFGIGADVAISELGPVAFGLQFGTEIPIPGTGIAIKRLGGRIVLNAPDNRGGILSHV